MNAILEVAAVSRNFGGVQALSDISFSVEPHSVVAVIGPNGAGKTTLLDVITGYTRPDEGDVRLDGTSILRSRPHHLPRAGLMRTFQSARLVTSLTARENVMLGANWMTKAGFWASGLRLPLMRREEAALRERADEVLGFLGLTQFADVLAGELPTGTQRILEVGRVLAGTPRVVLLDEPAAGLDDSETLELGHVLQAVKKSGVAMVIIEHNMGLVMSVSDKVVVLDAGHRIAEGSPLEVRRDPRVVRAYLGEVAE